MASRDETTDLVGRLLLWGIIIVILTFVLFLTFLSLPQLNIPL